MSTDLEWYLNVGGKQSGPLAAKEIVEMVRAGKIPATAQVTAARMGGDWVTAQDLIDAYDELYTKKPSGPARPILAGQEEHPFANQSSDSGDSSFSPPPRPTDQLERSKIIILDRGGGEDRPLDATESLFQAIQAVREKAQQKAGTHAATPTPSPGSKDSWGQLQRPAGGRLSSPLIFIVVITGILGALVYGFTGILGKKTETVSPGKVSGDAVPSSEPAGPPNGAASRSGTLLNSDPNQRAVRTAPPAITRPPSGSRGRERSEDRLERGGGARYRDDRDPPVEDAPDDADVDESESPPEGQTEIDPGTAVDPAQIGSDRAFPEPGGMPGMRNREDRNNGGSEQPIDEP